MCARSLQRPGDVGAGEGDQRGVAPLTAAGAPDSALGCSTHALGRIHRSASRSEMRVVPPRVGPFATSSGHARSIAERGVGTDRLTGWREVVCVGGYRCVGV